MNVCTKQRIDFVICIKYALDCQQANKPKSNINGVVLFSLDR